jgi:hypothetical protein
MTSDDEVDGALSVVVQLAVIACLGAIAIWAWPTGLLTRPMSSLTIASVFWALLSSAMWTVALGRLYFTVTPLVRSNAGQPYDDASAPWAQRSPLHGRKVPVNSSFPGRGFDR